MYHRTLKRTLAAFASTLFISGALSTSGQNIIFDDFNVDEGHFTSAIGASGTTVGEDPSSTIDRITTDGPLEGAGHQQLVLVHDASATAFRLRHLSGGGAPASNNAFTTSGGTDGFIGFYVKTTATGWETSINLDGPANVAGDMWGSTSVPIIADGAWHLYEWDLDASNWGSVPGIFTQTTGPLPDRSQTIDSIYFRDLDGSTGPTATIYFDFAAKSASGSIASLVPEPSTYAMFALGLAGFAGCRRLKLKKR
jgi:PEP-CTERM motif-containing protein